MPKVSVIVPVYNVEKYLEKFSTIDNIWFILNNAPIKQKDPTPICSNLFFSSSRYKFGAGFPLYNNSFEFAFCL